MQVVAEDRPGLDGGELTIAIVVARAADEEVAKRLLRGATEALGRHGVEDPDVFWVPSALDIAAMQAASGIMQVQLDTGVPIAYGVVATEDVDQALARSGPKNNAGATAAEAAIEMANVLGQIQG